MFICGGVGVLNYKYINTNITERELRDEILITIEPSENAQTIFKKNETFNNQ